MIHSKKMFGHKNDRFTIIRQVAIVLNESELDIFLLQLFKPQALFKKQPTSQLRKKTMPRSALSYAAAVTSSTGNLVPWWSLTSGQIRQHTGETRVFVILCLRHLVLLFFLLILMFRFFGVFILNLFVFYFAVLNLTLSSV